MGQHLFSKRVWQKLLSWCLGPPASSTCATSSVPWLCAAPHHLCSFTSFEESVKIFLCSFCLLGEIISTGVGRSNVKAFLPMWHFCITNTTHSSCLGINTCWWTEAETATTRPWSAFRTGCLLLQVRPDFPSVPSRVGLGKLCIRVGAKPWGCRGFIPAPPVVLSSLLT